MKGISRSSHIQKMRGLPCYRARPLLSQLISFEITQLQYQQHRDKSRPTRLNISIRPCYYVYLQYDLKNGAQGANLDLNKKSELKGKTTTP